MTNNKKIIILKKINISKKNNIYNKKSQLSTTRLLIPLFLYFISI